MANEKLTNFERETMAKYKGKWKFKEVLVSECTNHTFQVRKKNFAVNIDELKENIQVNGLLQPIGLARSAHTENSDIYTYEIVWGQRRHYAMDSLGEQKINAMVLDEVLSEAEGKALSVAENLIRNDMQIKDTWNAIKTIWIEFGTGDMNKDVAITSEKTGIPRFIIREAVQTEEIKNINGGEKWYKYLTEENMLPKSQALDILHLVRKPDGISVDEKKIKEFGDYLAAQKNEIRKDTIAVAKANPGSNVKEWAEAGKSYTTTKPRSVKIDFAPKDYEALNMGATSEGLSPEDWILKTILNKLTNDGFM